MGIRSLSFVCFRSTAESTSSVAGWIPACLFVPGPFLWPLASRGWISVVAMHGIDTFGFSLCIGIKRRRFGPGNFLVSLECYCADVVSISLPPPWQPNVYMAKISRSEAMPRTGEIIFDDLWHCSQVVLLDAIPALPASLCPLSTSVSS